MKQQPCDLEIQKNKEKENKVAVVVNIQQYGKDWKMAREIAYIQKNLQGYKEQYKAALDASNKAARTTLKQKPIKVWNNNGVIQKYEEEYQIAQVVIKQKYEEGYEVAGITSGRGLEAAQDTCEQKIKAIVATSGQKITELQEKTVQRNVTKLQQLIQQHHDVTHLVKQLAQMTIYNTETETNSHEL